MVEQTVDKREKINTLEEAFATLKWEIWETLPRFRRADIRLGEWQEECRRRLSEYPLLDYEQEQKYVRRRG